MPFGLVQLPEEAIRADQADFGNRTLRHGPHDRKELGIAKGSIECFEPTEPLLSINSQCQVDVVLGKFGKHDTDRPWEGKYDKDGR